MVVAPSTEHNCGDACPLSDPDLQGGAPMEKAGQSAAVLNHLTELCRGELRQNGASHGDVMLQFGISPRTLMAAVACANCIFSGTCERYGSVKSLPAADGFPTVRLYEKSSFRPEEPSN